MHVFIDHLLTWKLRRELIPPSLATGRITETASGQKQPTIHRFDINMHEILIHGDADTFWSMIDTNSVGMPFSSKFKVKWVYGVVG